MVDQELYNPVFPPVSYTHLDVYKRQVQEGAILESIVPHIKEMDLDSLKRELMIRLRGM